MRDFNTVGVVCAHLGRLMSSMKQGYYPVYGVNVKVNMEKIQECLKAIDMIIDKLYGKNRESTRDSLYLITIISWHTSRENCNNILCERKNIMYR